MQKDFIDTERELKELSDSLLNIAKLYYEKRSGFGQAKQELFSLMVPLQNDPRYSKAALEKQIMMMLADTSEEARPAIMEIYNRYITLEQDYKGLERLMDAYEAKISSLQSLLRWQRENT